MRRTLLLGIWLAGLLVGCAGSRAVGTNASPAPGHFAFNPADLEGLSLSDQAAVPRTSDYVRRAYNDMIVYSNHDPRDGAPSDFNGRIHLVHRQVLERTFTVPICTPDSEKCIPTLRRQIYVVRPNLIKMAVSGPKAMSQVDLKRQKMGPRRTVVMHDLTWLFLRQLVYRAQAIRDKRIVYRECVLGFKRPSVTLEYAPYRRRTIAALLSRGETYLPIYDLLRWNRDLKAFLLAKRRGCTPSWFNKRKAIRKGRRILRTVLGQRA